MVVPSMLQSSSDEDVALEEAYHVWPDCLVLVGITLVVHLQVAPGS